MVNVVKIQCPHCSDVYELYLSTKACVVVLNCPNCWTPILHNANGVHVLSDTIMERIRSRRHRAEVMDLLDKMDNDIAEPPVLEPDEKWLNGLDSDREPFVQCPVPVGDRDGITRDDILNLRIELATCRDAQQFIDKL